ncbi:MAG: TAXI family TRAP transporter solute-binding subunit [Spirochaetota bacterium]
MEKIKKTVVLVLMIAFIISMGTIGAQGQTETTKSEDPKFLSLAGGSVGGGWYVLCGVISEFLTPVLPDTNIKVATGGSVSNPSSVSAGKVEIAMTQDNIYADALAGTGPYASDGVVEDITGMLRLGEIYMSLFLVEEKSKYQSIQQIVDEKMPIRIVTAVQGASPSLATNRVLEAYGITPDKIKEWGGSISYVSYAEATSLMKDGHADAYCGPIMPATLELAVSKKLRPLPLDENIIDKLHANYKYGTSTIPAGKYDFIKEDLKVITENPILIVSSKLSDDVVYRVTKAICENESKVRASTTTYATWTPELAPQVNGGPIHPGAMQYYQEMGLVK